MEIIDSRIIESLRPNLLVPFYLINSYLYYQMDANVIHDNDYDKICQRLDREWDSISHPHKCLINRGDLSMTTCLANYEAFPEIVKSAAFSLLKLSQARKINTHLIRSLKWG